MNNKINEIISILTQKNILDKPKSEETILKLYDLLSYKRPDKIVWLDKITDIELNNNSPFYTYEGITYLYNLSDILKNSIGVRPPSILWNEMYKLRIPLLLIYKYKNIFLGYNFNEYVFIKYNNKNLNSYEENIIKINELLLEAMKYGVYYKIQKNNILYLAPYNETDISGLETEDLGGNLFSINQK